MSNLQNILSSFNFYEITRKCSLKPGRLENDAEHSWFVAYLYLFLQKDLEKEFLELDSQKILTLIIIHDIGELKSGDIATWNKKEEDKQDEILTAREELATKMNRQDLFDLYLELEDSDPCLEVKIVASLDRIAPVLIRIYSGIGWFDVDKKASSLEELNKRHIPRHRFSVTMMNLYKEAVKLAVSQNLFPD